MLDLAHELGFLTLTPQHDSSLRPIMMTSLSTSLISKENLSFIFLAMFKFYFSKCELGTWEGNKRGF